LRVALISRDELYPVHGGGIGQFVTAAARLLSRIAEVTIFTTSRLQETYERLRAAGDPRLPGDGVRVVFVPEPSVEEAGAWYHVMHCYSARLYDRLREVYPDGGPELIEFADYLGEGFVTVQAARALDPFLAATRIGVRVHTTAELCELLDGYCKPDRPSRTVHELERFVLAGADRMIWQGGDVLGTYQRFYGPDALAPALRIRYPYAGALGGDDDAFRVGDRPLRLLYAGRLERRKGVLNLVRAVTGMARDDFRLTLVGGDTTTGSLGTSIRGQLELAIAEDGRIELREALDRAELAQLIRAHDVVVVPSLWECWPYAALEPLHLNRPVLGTPVGGLVELIAPGRSGWLAAGTDAVALEEALEGLLAAPENVEELVRAGAPLAYARELADETEILDAYQELARVPLRRARARARASRLPLISAIVPYYRASRYVRETVESLLAQTYPRMEIVLVNDGSFEEEDWVLAEIAGRLPVVVVTQMNQGLGAARNFGVLQSRGRYVFPLDADNAAEPEFVARCVEILERRPEVAYVTSWSRYVEDDGTPRPGPNLGYEPLGNQATLLREENVAGDAAAVIRRRLFDAGFRYSEELTSYEDWALYRRLAQADHIGAVIPERLLRYRVREDSMQAQIAQPNRERLLGEIEAHIQENEMRWTSSSA
jgi:glycosyltransferase involved in cell wall biosynthesis